MEATRLPALFRTAVSNASPFSKLRFFSSPSAATQRAWQFYSDDADSTESAVYKHALKFQQPSTVQIKPHIHNSVSLIGTVDRPFRRFNTADGSLGGQTWLSVSTTSVSRPFKIKLKMWGDIAELSMVHLKWNDLIYVWGYLKSFVKAGQEGNPRVFHELIVKEINFVARHDKASTCQESKTIESWDEDRLEKSNSRLHLWQVFFSNPSEWWDNRKNKVNHKGPDFKHRYSGEALWLQQNDPPWIRRQLELLDSRPVVKDTGYSQVSPLKYDGEYY
ncbi:protein OSB1, mitochondrial-like [Ipomoea triloba]|uniref:protein OSB1, mitochondrial-like n=1 Tax=Ipomoea triloba TaxID=35885 RepID=UPI00125D4A37|nr:protein OSB1, mitochondrial-like [Ipomoea triloba]